VVVTGETVGHDDSTQSKGLSVTIHSQLAAASQALLLSSIPEQNELVDGESPKQHPGAGTVGSIVGLPVTTSVGSGVGRMQASSSSNQVHSAAFSQA
jgi:hypothetical protein